jgi:hypothetical protein
VHEKRLHLRVPIEVDVTCELPDGSILTGVARDISLGGMYVECAKEVPFGVQLTIAGTLPGLSEQTRLPAVVRWSKAGGFGVQFGLLGARETHAITRLMRSK